MGVLSVLTLGFLMGALVLVTSRPASYLGPVHVPIVKRSNISDRGRGKDLTKAVDAIRRKYGFTTQDARRSGGGSVCVSLTDEQSDVSYSGVVSIGTPAKGFNVLLDTGSSDLWVATTACATCASITSVFDPSSSSTYQNVTSTLEFDYGSGTVNGYVSEDTIALGGLMLQNQQFLAVDVITPTDLFDGTSLSGIMGLGFESISVLQTPPIWQTLYAQNMLPESMFAFYLERHINQPNAADTAPGGALTLGGTNSTLYTGNIEFIDMPNGTTPGYWLQQVETVTIQGVTISIPNESSLAAIDTGTTLIGAPSSIAQQIWNEVPGSVPLTGSQIGMYAYPCDTEVTVRLSFGGTTWPIHTADMNFGTVNVSSEDGISTETMCVGGIFAFPDIGTTQWIIGDVFLKNVYSVFRADPPAVGFARLANGLEGSASSSTLDNIARLLPLALSSLFLTLLFMDPVI